MLVRDRFVASVSSDRPQRFDGATSPGAGGADGPGWAPSALTRWAPVIETELRRVAAARVTGPEASFTTA